MLHITLFFSEEANELSGYTSGILDMNDITNNTIIWHDYDQIWIRQKRKHVWYTNDSNLQCVFVRMNTVNFFLTTDYCDGTGVAICQYPKG